jgi:hypothetical protein
VCVCVLGLALLSSAESDAELALESAIGTMANHWRDFEPADAVFVEVVGGGRSVFHSKGIIERQRAVASFIL